MTLARLLLAAAPLALCGCSSLNSSMLASDGASSGLVYYMPKKDFLATLTVTAGKVSNVAFSTTAAYPDTAHAYVLDSGVNLVGRNTLNVQVTPAGLMTSSDATTTSELPQVLTSLAGSVGGVGAAAARAKEAAAAAASPGACSAGEHVVRICPEVAEDESLTVCGITIRTVRAGGVPAGSSAGTASSRSGVYYRQNQAYFLTATEADPQAPPIAAAILLSPSQSPDRFLAVKRTLFSSNHATLAFDDGVLKSYSEDTEGEALALVKLPADIISAYAAGIGSVFSAFSARDQSQAGALNASLQLQLAKQKYDACTQAIRNKDTATQTALGC